MASISISAPKKGKVSKDWVKKQVSSALKHTVLISIAFFSLAPILWLIGIAFRPEEQAYTTPMMLLPRSLTLENFRYIFRKVPQMAVLYRNSIIITGVTVASVVIISSLAGYAFAKLKFPGKDVIFWLVMIAMFMPRSMAIPSLYQLLTRLRLLDTYAGLFLPYTAWWLPLNIFIMRSAFASIPQELEDAARIDGASPFRVYWQVMLPLAASSAVTVAIFTFVPVWGEYLFAFTFTTTVKAMPMGVGIKLLKPGAFSGEWTFPVAASATLATFVPPLLIYIGLQKWFTKGLLEGALKF
jgi:ABC-type glycerol-3-phosphate transport system permease component